MLFCSIKLSIIWYKSRKLLEIRTNSVENWEIRIMLENSSKYDLEHEILLKYSLAKLNLCNREVFKSCVVKFYNNVVNKWCSAGQMMYVSCIA